MTQPGSLTAGTEPCRPSCDRRHREQPREQSVAQLRTSTPRTLRAAPDGARMGHEDSPARGHGEDRKGHTWSTANTGPGGGGGWRASRFPSAPTTF